MPSEFREDPARPVVRPISDTDRAWITDRTTEWWAAPVIVSRGRMHRPAELAGFVAEIDGRRVGLISLHIEQGECEIVTLNSVEPGTGAGSALLAAAEQYAGGHGCRRLWLITTNGKTQALRFYQRRGFSTVARHEGAIRQARLLKPEIPLTGEDGIPIQDEIELARDLTSP